MSSLDLGGTTTPFGDSQGSSQSSADDIALMQKVFRAAAQNPLLIPNELVAFLIDSVQTSKIILPISQIQGFSQFTAQSSYVDSLDTTTSGYGDLTHVGPTLDGLPDGRYVVLWGAYASGSSGPTIASASMAISLNGASAPNGDHSLAASSTTDIITSMMVADTFILNAGGSNKLQAKYASGDSSVTAKFENRFLIALRYANL